MNKLIQTGKLLLALSGLFFITLLILAFTTLPFWAYYNLGTRYCQITKPPAVIVVLSGNGIPSSDALLKSYYTAKLYKANPTAKIIIAMPGNPSDSSSDPNRFAADLRMRGVDNESITFEHTGRNTHEQAIKISAGKNAMQLRQPVVIIASPEHIRRSVLVFRKCGFTDISGLPTFEFALNADLSFSDHEMKGNKLIPNIGNNLQLRYQFWNHLKYEILVAREYFALGYYKMRGWI